jgi:hypothetical protein
VVAQALRGRERRAGREPGALLFALCGKAQGRAAELALAAARGTGNARRTSIPVHIEHEALREHLWRWLLDLPPLLGAAAMQFEFVEAMRWHEPRAACRTRRLSRRRAHRGSGWHPREETRTIRRSGASACCRRSMRGFAGVVARSMPGFVPASAMAGRAAETGAFARRGRRGRRRARWPCAGWRAWTELRDWAHGRKKSAPAARRARRAETSGRGRALVETARGLLMHEIVLDGERIADYFIVAPTEWNFHPQGPIAGWLKGRDAGNREALNAFAARAVAALDPCVRWELEWL